MKTYWQLFKSFFRVGILTFGGGYAMLPILRREVVEDHPWCTDEELADYYAIGQCTPGIIAVNTATFIGFKLKGIPGAVAATLSLVLPGFLIILVIASVLENFAHLPLVINAFAGIRVAVAVLVFNAVLKLLKTSATDKITWIIFLLVFLLASVLPLSPVVYVLAAGLAGVGLHTWKEVGRK